MRKLKGEERDILRGLDEGVTTADLITIVRDMGELLRSRSHVVQANVAQLAADRLLSLSASSANGTESRLSTPRSNMV